MITASADRRDWRAWCDIADRAAAAGRWPEVVTALQQAAALNPTNPAIPRNLAGVLLNMGRSEAALDAFQRVIEIDPANIRDRLGYAGVLVDLGRPRDAMVEIEEAARLALTRVLPDGSDHEAPISITTDRVTDIRDLGLLLDRLNQVDDLRRLLAAAEQAGIGADVLGSLWAAVALREGQPKEAKQYLLQEGAHFDDAHWDRLMTKVADALGDAEQAFSAAEAMNRAVPGYEQWRRHTAHFRAQIRATSEIVTPEWAARIPHASPEEGVPVPAFVVGFPRSGTTLLDTYLMGHPDTCVVEEGRMLELATEVVSQSPGADWPAELVIRARQVYLDELATHVSKSFTGLIVDKHPLNMLRLAVLHALFPTAKVLFAQRHPCDVVLSGFMQSFRLNNAMACFLHLADAADLYDASMTMWTRSREAVPQSVHTIVYERLIADPETELRPALDFLDLDWRDELLDHQATAKSRGLITTASFDQIVQPLSKAPSGRWRRYRKQLEPVLPVLLPWARRLGYED